MSKIIWQTHDYLYEDLPQSLRSASATWQTLNPGWEYRYVSAKQRSEMIRAFDLELHKKYLELDMQTQSDIWRIVVLYEHGGIYTDLDSVCTMPLDYFLEKHLGQAEVAINKAGFQQSNENIINLSTLYSVKNSKALKDAVDIFKKYIDVADPQTIFSISLEPHRKLICQDLSLVAMHSEKLKTAVFDGRLLVNYFGEQKRYKDLAKEFGWKL